MTKHALRLFLLLIAAFVFAVAVLLAAAIGGLGLLDIVRGYVAGEGAYSKSQKAAVLALHRYAEDGSAAHFEEYLQSIDIPLGDAKARAVLEDPEAASSESYGYLIEGGNHPQDVAGIAWLFRTFGGSELMAPSIELWRRADRKILELHAAAHDLHRYLQSPDATQRGVAARLDRIDVMDRQLVVLGEAFARNMGASARRLSRLLTFGIVGLGLVLIALAVVAALYLRAYTRRSARLIRHRENRFRDVAEMSADWIWETDADDRLTYLSDRAEAIAGRPKEELLGTRRWDLADTRTGPWQVHRQTVASRDKIAAFEFETETAGGEVKTIRISGKPIYDEEGRYLGYRGTGTDVTAEVLARREAERRRELLDNSFENLGQGIVVVDGDGNVVMFNRRLCELLEIPEEELRVGSSFADFFYYLAQRGEYGPGDARRLADERLALVARTQPYVFERPRPNGTIMEVRGQPLPSGGFVVACRDVTETRMAQAAIERSERFMRGVVDSALDAFVSVDRSDRVIDWNPAAEKMFGWSRGEAMGHSLAELVLPERLRAAHREVLLTSLQGDGGRVTGGRRETVARRRDGTKFSVEVSLSAQEAAGATIFTAFIRDITRRKEFETRLMEAKEAAEAANRAKSQFLANMSHELRTPLNAIIGFADIMERQIMGPIGERYGEYAGDIRQSGSHLLALINDILDISSVESGKALGEVSPVDLHEEVATCAHLLAQTAAAAGVALVNEVSEAAPRLVAEPRRLRQILLNLMGNSVKFSPPGTAVSVRVELDDEGLCLLVIDRGRGMQPDQVEKVFEPFVQLRSGVDRSHLGTGLGLTLVRNLVEMHGGRIVLQSAPEKGTTAYVHFPASRVAPAAPGSVQEASR